MATAKQNKTKVTEVISEQKRVDNSANEGRAYDIAATLYTNHGKMQNISSGTVRKDDKQIATFDANPNNTSYNELSGTIEEKMAVIAAIDEFVTDVNAEQTGITI